ncbi:MAG: menaquinone biosynthesis decarboxylase [Alistipes sp.]|jgi:4-hydroxy-3-polyprenylbenzoate decarboxylase|nr:menaquinone biosynthesis decarboxylase [Alistipes sp.]
MYKNLSTYIGLLEKEGELVRVAASVSPLLEIAEITDRVSKSPGGGRALLFENVEGSRFPVVTNLFGSERRIAMALGAGSLDEISARLEDLLGRAFSLPRAPLAEKMKALPMLAEMSRWMPRRVRGRGECQQTVLRGDEARLSMLPVLKCWPHDGGRFVTLPLVHTADPVTGAPNVGMYRMQIFDDRSTGMHWHIHKTGARHYEAHRKAGVRRMPVSVCLGGDPAYTYAATAPMPEGMDEYMLAGFLRRRPVRLVRCVTNDLWVPADCDFVIEGWVDTTEPLRTEGPFGDHTGFYSLEDPYPIFHVEAITHRRDAVYPATVVGVPPQEDAWFAAATERIFLPPIRAVLQPEVCDLHMPPAGVAHNLAMVAVEAAYAGQTEKIAGALWGAGQMMFNKVLVAVPAGFPIRDPEAVLELLRGVDPGCDLVFGHGVLDVLDHATATSGVGGKLLIDATRASADGGGDNFEIVFDPAAEGLTPYERLWLALANIDPARDVTARDGVMRVDARAKISRDAGMPSRWPNVVVMDRETAGLVDRRWAEYGLGDFADSPSNRYRKLLLSDGAQAATAAAIKKSEHDPILEA